MYIQCNIEARLCNHCCSVKSINVTYFEHMFIALGTQHAMHMCRTVIYGLPGFTVFFHIMS